MKTSDYPDIERQLAEREAKHKAHAAKMEEQRIAKIDARDRHRRGEHRIKYPAYCLK